MHRFINQRLNDGSIALRGFIHVVGVFGQLLQLLICLPSTFSSSFQGVCFKRNLPGAALLRHNGVLEHDNLRQTPFPTDSSRSFAVRGKVLAFCLWSWFHLVVYQHKGFLGLSKNLRTREKIIFLLSPVTSLEIVLWCDLSLAIRQSKIHMNVWFASRNFQVIFQKIVLLVLPFSGYNTVLIRK